MILLLLLFYPSQETKVENLEINFSSDIYSSSSHSYCLIFFFETGLRISWNHHPGFPAVRVTLAQKFAKTGGFGAVLHVLQSPETSWLGADGLSILFRAFCEVRKRKEMGWRKRKLIINIL
jgi:hypothetical protein